MTVAITSTYARAAGNGVTTVFNFPFLVFAAGDIVVRDITDATGASATKTLTTDYSVTISATTEGGSITFVTAPAAAHTIDIRRTTPLTQPEDIVNQGRFLPELHEGSFDRLETQIQDLSRRVNSTIRQPDYEQGFAELPAASSRASKYVVFDSGGALAVIPGSNTDSFLRADLANPTTPGLGNELISYRRTPAETAAGVTPSNFSYETTPMLSASRFEVIGDGIADDTTALKNWLLVLGQSSQKAIGFLPAGTYKYTANLSVPANVYILGVGNQRSILKPTAAVTVALATANDVLLKGISIDGANTTNALGLHLAPSTTDYNFIEDVWVQNFTGATGIGVRVNNSVGLTALRLFVIGCGTPMKVLSDTPASLPTTCSFVTCRFADSTIGPGVQINSGQSIVFSNDCIFETNIAQGLLAQSVVGGLIMDLKIENAWFEDNYHGHVDTGTKVYSLQVDGTAGSGANADLSDIRFSQGSGLSDRKSVLMNNAVGSFSRLRGYYGFAFEFVVTGSSLVQVLNDTADRCGRMISNAGGSPVVYPLYSQIFDNGDGTSILPTINKLVGVAYSASMTFDAFSADEFVISATNGTAFTINAPTKPMTGRVITITIRNASGGALGAATWNAVFKLGGWVQPVNTASRSIIFRYDGSNWIEITRGVVDVPN